VADGRTVELAPVGAADVRATLTATPKAWGTRLEWSCSYPSAGTAPGEGGRRDGYGSAAPAAYELVLVDSGGRRTVVATWAATGTAAKGLAASAATPLTAVTRVEIVVEGSDEALASAEL
jgi:hypothetical protein